MTFVNSNGPSYSFQPSCFPCVNASRSIYQTLSGRQAFLYIAVFEFFC